MLYYDIFQDYFPDLHALILQTDGKMHFWQTVKPYSTSLVRTEQFSKVK